MEKRKIRKYTEDFKRSSAKLAIESDQSISAHHFQIKYSFLTSLTDRLRKVGYIELL